MNMRRTFWHAQMKRGPDTPSPHSDGYFSINQGWLNPGGKRSVLKDLANLVHILIQEAEKVVSPIHQVVFPEAALTTDLAKALARLLAKQHPNLETVIAGTLGKAESPLEPGYEFYHNAAIQVDLVDQKIATVVWRKKHHRWKLDTNQVEQYDLQGILDANHSWWERLKVFPRELAFVNRRGRIQTVLICEDLARFDPVLPLINSVGPNLVIALLIKTFADKCLANFRKAYPGIVEHYQKAEKVNAAARSKHQGGKTSKHSKNIDDSLFLNARS